MADIQIRKLDSYGMYNEEFMNLIIHKGENHLSQEWLDSKIAELNALHPEYAQRFQVEREERGKATWNQPHENYTYLDPQEGDDGAPPED